MRTRQRPEIPAEVAARIGVEARSLHANIEPGAHAHRAASLDVVVEAWEQVDECALATGQEPVGVPPLGDTGAPLGRAREVVALQDEHVLKVTRERSGGRQATDASADDDGASADQPGGPIRF